MNLKSLKILHIVPTLTKNPDGVSVFVKKIADFTFSHLQKLVIVTLENDFIEEGRFDIFSFKRNNFLYKFGISSPMKLWIKNNINYYRIIHNHGLWMMPNVYFRNLISNKQKLIISPHGALSQWAFKRSWHKKILFWTFFQKYTLNKATIFHATSFEEYSDIRRHGFKQPVFIIPIGIDLKLIPETKVEKKQQVLFLARIHPVKGLETLIHAWKILGTKTNSWELKIVGPLDNYYAKKMKALSQKLELKNVVFSGPLYGVDKFHAYMESQLYVLPTNSENFGLTVLESLACSTPVIVTKAAPWSDLETYNAGWWIENGLDPLVEKLSEALTINEIKLKVMGKNGRKLVEDKFVWEKVSNDFFDVYSWLDSNASIPNSVLLK